MHGGEHVQNETRASCSILQLLEKAPMFIFTKEMQTNNQLDLVKVNYHRSFRIKK